MTADWQGGKRNVELEILTFGPASSMVMGNGTGLGSKCAYIYHKHCYV